jgi:hypothetical protein
MAVEVDKCHDHAAKRRVHSGVCYFHEKVTIEIRIKSDFQRFQMLNRDLNL